VHTSIGVLQMLYTEDAIGGGARVACATACEGGARVDSDEAKKEGTDKSVHVTDA
jgi:hypothetical protein